MKTTNLLWITCSVAAAVLAWQAGRATAPAPPPAPAIPWDPPVPAPPEPPTPAPRPALPDILQLAATADGEADAIARQQTLQQAARLLSHATAQEARELFLTTRDAYLQKCALRRWAELDPQPALNHLTSRDAQQRALLPAGYKPLVNVLFQGWAHSDPAAALKAAGALPMESEYSEVEFAIICQATADDVARGTAVMTERFRWGEPFRVGGRQMWEHQPAAFTRSLFAYTTGGRNRLSLDMILGHGVDSATAWAASDAAGFVVWAAQHFAANPTEARFHAELFGLFLQHAPDAAGEAFAATPPGELRNKMREQYVAHLATADPGAAVAWLEENLTSGRDAAYRTWAEAVAKSAGHEQSAALANTLQPGRGRDAASEAALYAWAAKDVSAAVAWAKSQPAAADVRAAISHLAYPWLQHQSQDAARYILANPTLGWGGLIVRAAARSSLPLAETAKLAAALPPEFTSEAAEGLGERVGRETAPFKSIAALTSEQQLIAVRTAAEVMAHTDRAKASTWIATLPAGPLRTAADDVLRTAAP